MEEIENSERCNIIGDPTEGALLVSAIKAGVSEDLPRLDEIPFESEKRYMATLHKSRGNHIPYLKGSPERILKITRDQLITGETQPLEDEKVSAFANKMAENALKVVGFAYKFVSNEKTEISDADIMGFTFLGLQGMIYPPREEVVGAIKKAKEAGIRTVMITRDHARTGKAIAEQLGMVQAMIE